MTMKRVVKYCPMTSSPGQPTWARVALVTGAPRQRNVYEFQLRHFSLGLFIRIATPLAFFAMYSWEIVALTTSGNHVSQDDTVAVLLGR